MFIYRYIRGLPFIFRDLATLVFQSEHFRAIIFYNFRCGSTQQQWIWDSTEVIVRPKSVVVPEIIDAVRLILIL